MTSALVSADAFAAGAPVAFIATGLNFPDALSGGPAAVRLGGPLLLTMPGSVPDAIAEELSRLQPGRIVVLGSHPTVTDEVAEILREFTTGEVTRLAGPSRYDTSALTSAAAFPAPVPVVYLATGHNFPDALSGAPAAGVLGGPLLVTHPNRLSAEIAQELRRLRPERIVILGSHPTMSHRVHLELGQYLR
ncbi:MAG TPA: cell wall-binding repeat-containing protein [Brevibacterium sp.]|nr:cell wall-binding repeat-containing protein [Brevibacterium sp.]